jgi:radical SAM-linked protein
VELRQTSAHISLPSLRVDSLSNEIIELINKMNQTGLTIAPEAGSQRLRNVINKSLSEEEIIAGIQIALDNNWQLIKLYFMLGLPTETWQDIEELVRLIEKIVSLSRKKLQLNISLSPFVPKPFTPFQWAAMDSKEHLLEKIHFIKNSLKKYKFVKIKYHTIENQMLEGVIGRGDKRVAEWILQAYKDGAFFDGWSEYFDFSIWENAAAKINLKLDDFTCELNKDKPLPWDHIDMGINTDFLLEEWDKAMLEKITPDCREVCTNCGICHQECQPVYRENNFEKKELIFKESDQNKQDSKTFYRIFFAKMGEMRFVGHLDLLRTFQRMLKASGLPLHYSVGFHPKPFLSLCPPLAIGVQGENEYFDFALASNLPLDVVEKKARDVFPKALLFRSISYSNDKNMRAMEYFPVEEMTVKPDATFPASYWQEKTENFRKSEKWLLLRTRKGVEKENNLKQIITDISWTNGELYLQKNRIGATIYDILEAVYGVSREEAGAYLITRKIFLQK